MARTFHRHRHGDENVQSKCQQFKKKKEKSSGFQNVNNLKKKRKWRYSKIKIKKWNVLKVRKFTQI